MYELIRLFLAICLLKKAPQDIPHSRLIFWITLFFNAAVGFLVFFLSSELLDTLLQLFVGVVIILLLPGAILYINGKISRYYQTVSAMLGTDALIGFFALPVLAYFETGRSGLIPTLILTGLIFWQWVVAGHIFRHALSKPLLYGLVVALIYLVFGFQVMAYLAYELTRL